MAIIVNDTNIPSNGNYIKVGSTNIDKVDVVKNGVTTTVWEKVLNITPPSSEVLNYVNISGSNEGVSLDACSSGHNGIKFSASIWYAKNQFKQSDSTWVISPKYPYTKISCSIHTWNDNGLTPLYGGKTEVYVNGVLRLTTVYDNITGEIFNVIDAPSITIRCLAEGQNPNHWKSIAGCCIYDATFS